MPDKIRVGIVGATVTQGGSGWGANAHVPAIKLLPEYELKAVCTSREETAQASKEKFGAELAFHDINDMAAHPDIDLIVVSVRVPWHRDLVMAGLKAGKPVFCEWPLGANLAEAEEMNNLAKEKSLKTMVGLQARSDPSVMYARDLIAQGQIGEVLTASLSVVSGAQIVRGPGRIWQGQRSNGANTFTISGGHAFDAMCAILGEFDEVEGRLATRIKNWQTEEGQPVPVDSPDVISFAGALQSGAEVAVHIASVPSNPGGSVLTIYGSEGALSMRGGMNIGNNQLAIGKGKDPLTEAEVPDKYKLVPEGTPSGPPRNVAQAYVRAADAWAAGETFSPDFELAVVRHKLIDAIERSAADGKAVKVSH
jgi:predicted dehydrogenase